MTSWPVGIGLLAVAFTVGVAGVALGEWLSQAASGPKVELNVSAGISPIDRIFEDEGSVYLAAMNEEGVSPANVVIMDETSPSCFESYEWTEESQDGSDAEIAYRLMNRQCHSLRVLFGNRYEASFISRDDLRRLDGVDFWRVFHFRHPLSDGYVTLSRVGFNRGRTEAVVHIGLVCGALCGHYVTWKFTKQDGVWVKTGKIGPDFVS